MGGEERGVASFFQWGSPPRRAQSQADRTEKIRRVLFLRVCWPCFFFSPPSFLFPEKEKKGCGRLTAARGVRNSAPHTCIKPDRVILPWRAIGEPPAYHRFFIKSVVYVPARNAGSPRISSWLSMLTGTPLMTSSHMADSILRMVSSRVPA